MVLSSNFGNMFSIAFATLLLPFLPMLPVQILINNFLYDISQTAIPADNVDESYTRLPQHWNLRLIRSYMFIFGFTSSIFDFVTFYLLYNYFSVSEAQFRTGWFMESLATQILVVFIIRTNDLPFIRSKPAKVLVLSTLTCLAIGWILPYSQFGGMIGFEPLPANVILFIISNDHTPKMGKIILEIAPGISEPRLRRLPVEGRKRPCPSYPAESSK